MMQIGYELRNFTPNNYCRQTAHFVILKNILVPVCEKDTESSDFTLGVTLKDYLILAFSLFWLFGRGETWGKRVKESV